MFHRVKVFSVFVKQFAIYAMMVREVLFCLVGLILGGGFLISIVEELDLGSAVYFAFITGLTIGYGEITPQTVAGRVVAILIGIVGMVFIGLIVGIASRALADLQQKQMQSVDAHEEP